MIFWSFRRCDIFCRIDADRYAFLVPANPGEDMVQMIERMNNTLESIKKQTYYGKIFDYRIDYTPVKPDANADVETLLDRILNSTTAMRAKPDGMVETKYRSSRIMEWKRPGNGMTAELTSQKNLTTIRGFEPC